jgi:hypothetical protein
MAQAPGQTPRKRPQLPLVARAIVPLMAHSIVPDVREPLGRAAVHHETIAPCIW